jgi:hypothetical protein
MAIEMMVTELYDQMVQQMGRLAELINDAASFESANKAIVATYVYVGKINKLCKDLEAAVLLHNREAERLRELRQNEEVEVRRRREERRKMGQIHDREVRDRLHPFQGHLSI